MRTDPSVLIDGDPPTAADLIHQALVNYGAYTSFRVEAGGARGLGRHLERLRSSSLALFDAAPDEARLRDLMRGAIAGQDACWLRVSLFSPEITARKPSWRGEPKVMTMTAPPPPPLATSVRLHLQRHERDQPTIKHSAILGLIHARRAAREAGFDDALFVNGEGLISEGSSWNVGFLKAGTVVWPQAPMLAGVAQALIEANLAAVGLSSETRPVRLHDLGAFDGAFICNSATPACAVTGIGDRMLDTNVLMVEKLALAWGTAPAEAI
ncbi:MAG: aminotransferase class IV [Brevundimonas sp.]|uniref:aminotransferase class IV n=1 Tax=Brevundimonas sp. TaxID=1871086 RepID=UPI004034901C